MVTTMELNERLNVVEQELKELRRRIYVHEKSLARVEATNYILVLLTVSILIKLFIG